MPEVQVEYSGAACIFLAVLFLAVPLDWLMAGIIAAGIHELCHILAVRLLGGRVLSLTLGGRGARIRTSPMEPGRELLSILAGPGGSLSLILFAPWVPRTAICGCIQGIYNLLPVYPLDGGRALRCLLRCIKISCKERDLGVQ